MGYRRRSISAWRRWMAGCSRSPRSFVNSRKVSRMQRIPEPSAMSSVFEPAGAHERRHGPRGYVDDEHYKPWLRDEFVFRCLYCRCREVWFPDGDPTFSVEHLQPTSLAPDGL